MSVREVHRYLTCYGIYIFDGVSSGRHKNLSAFRSGHDVDIICAGFHDARHDANLTAPNVHDRRSNELIVVVDAFWSGWNFNFGHLKRGATKHFGRVSVMHSFESDSQKAFPAWRCLIHDKRSSVGSDLCTRTEPGQIARVELDLDSAIQANGPSHVTYLNKAVIVVILFRQMNGSSDRRQRELSDTESPGP